MNLFNPFSWFTRPIKAFEVSLIGTGFSMYIGATSEKQAIQKVKKTLQSGGIGFEGLSRINLEDTTQYRVELI